MFCRKTYNASPKVREKREIYKKEHPEQFLEYYRKYRKTHPERIIWRAAKQRAKNKNLAFDIEITDITIPEFCPILGIPLIIHSGNGTPGGKENSPSLDRIDNNKGYIKGNIQVISHKANSMKFTANKEELLLFAKWIYKTYND